MLRRIGTYVRQHHLALLALFIALTGTASAATGYPANIIGTRQLKDNAVTSAKVKDGSLTGADILESSLGQVPSAANADELGGLPASAYQQVQAIRAVPNAGNNVFTDLGHGLHVATVCHDGGQVEMVFQNVGSGAATLNFLYSDGTSLIASGLVLPAGTGEYDAAFLGKRIEGQFIFASSAGNTTVNLHAFDGGTFCETQGTAEFAAVS